MARNITALWLSVVLAACAAPAERAARAAAEGQAALDRGDVAYAREALARAVQAYDGSPVLWVALGRAHLRAADYGGAFFAYSRAAELDQANVEALQVLAELSLARGDVRGAVRYADQLELIQPGSPGPQITRGFAALARSRPDDALRAAEKVLGTTPGEEAAVILKARALEAKGHADDGARVLEAHVAARGPTGPALNSLLALYRKAGADDGVLRTRARLVALEPNNGAQALDYARALYAAGDREAGRRVTARLASAKDGEHLADVLAIWLAHEPPAQARRNAEPLIRMKARMGEPAEKVLLADFLLDLGRADEAEGVLRALGGPPVDAGNADATAVLADARAAQGRADEAGRMLDAVLAFDPSNILALRARTDLHLAAGRADAALAAARRLVRESPSTPKDRIRLASTYAAARQPALVESTYWAAFNDLPGDATIYAALKAHLLRSGKADALAGLDRRYQEQLQALRSRRA